MKKINLIMVAMLLAVSIMEASVVKVTIDLKQKVYMVERGGDISYTKPLGVMKMTHDPEAVAKLAPKTLGTMSTFGIGDTFNVVNDNSPIPYPSWRFMRYFSVNTGSNPIAFASIKICDALDTTSGNWLYYTTGMPIYSTDDSLLTDFGVWDPCIQYAYGVDLYVAGDTAKSPLEIVQLRNCTGVESIQSAETFTVFPNPVSDVFFSNSQALFGNEVQIASIDGRLVWKGQFPQEGLDLRFLKPGVYVLTTENQSVRFVKKE